MPDSEQNHNNGQRPEDRALALKEVLVVHFVTLHISQTQQPQAIRARMAVMMLLIS